MMFFTVKEWNRYYDNESYPIKIVKGKIDHVYKTKWVELKVDSVTFIYSDNSIDRFGFRD